MTHVVIPGAGGSAWYWHRPAETPGEWWEATGWSAQRTTPFDAERDFLHEEALTRSR